MFDELMLNLAIMLLPVTILKVVYICTWVIRVAAHCRFKCSYFFCITCCGRCKWNLLSVTCFLKEQAIFFTSNQLNWNWWQLLWFTKEINIFCNRFMLFTWNEMIRKVNILRLWQTLIRAYLGTSKTARCTMKVCLLYNNGYQFFNIGVHCVLKPDVCTYRYVHDKLNNWRFICFFSL